MTIALASSLVISANTVLDANDRAVTLDGQQSVGVFIVQANVQFTLIGVRVTGGRAVQGGGLYSAGGQVELRGCTFTANAASGTPKTLLDDVSAMGGAITCVGGGITATNVQFMANTAASGTNSVIASGGAVGLVTSSGLFQSCIFEGNLAHGSDYQLYPLALASSARGGAVASLGGGQFQLRSCTFSENQALGGQGFRSDSTTGSGGAVYCDYGSISAENCTFISNAAAAGNYGFYDQDAVGGAIYTAGGGNLENSLFSLNRAVSGASALGAGEYRNDDAMGGAVFNDGNLAITGCAFASNRVETPLSIEVSLGVNYGGALYSAGDCSIINSTFIQNVAAPQRLANLPTDLFGVAYGAAIYQSLPFTA